MNERTVEELILRVGHLERHVAKLLAVDEDPAPEPVGEFDEPWKICQAHDRLGILDAKGLLFVNTYDRKRLEHIIACVNALAGVKNVAEVGPVVRWARDFMSRLGTFPLTTAEQDLRALLSALDTPPKELQNDA